MPPELVPPALAAGAAEVVLRCRTVPDPAPALGETDDPAFGDLPTDVALAAGPGFKETEEIANQFL